MPKIKNKGCFRLISASIFFFVPNLLCILKASATPLSLKETTGACRRTQCLLELIEHCKIHKSLQEPKEACRIPQKPLGAHKIPLELVGARKSCQKPAEACRNLQEPAGACRSPQELAKVHWSQQELERACRSQQKLQGAHRSPQYRTEAHSSLQEPAGAHRNPGV